MAYYRKALHGRNVKLSPLYDYKVLDNGNLEVKFQHIVVDTIQAGHWYEIKEEKQWAS